MKKLVLILVVLMLLAGVAYANNAVRIKELQTRGQELIQQIQQAQRIIEQGQAELLKIQGAIEELQKQDAPPAIAVVPAEKK